MKVIVMSLALVFCNTVFAYELTSEQQQEIIKNVQKFDKDCPKFGKKKVVKAVTVSNATGSSVDKNAMEGFIKEHLDLEIEASSPLTLEASLSSKATSKGKKHKETFTLALKLTETIVKTVSVGGRDGGGGTKTIETKKTVCDKSYANEFDNDIND